MVTITILLVILIVAVLVINPLITKQLITSVPNVWDGGFEIILSDNQIISGSFHPFQNDYHKFNGIDIPKGQRIEEIVIRKVPKGFVPMLITSGGVETRLATSISDFSEKDHLTDLHFEVTNPEVLPILFSFSVASNQGIAHGGERSTKGLFFPQDDINIWYNRPGTEL